MFEAICLRDGGTEDHKIDYGLLAESLVFYGAVHFVSGPRTYHSMLRRIGPYVLSELLRSGYLTIHVAPKLLGVVTVDGRSARERHDVGFIQLVEDRDPIETAGAEFVAAAGGGSKHRRAGMEFARRLHFVNKKSDTVDLNAIRQDLRDPTLFESVIVSWLEALAPDVVQHDAKVETWELAGATQFYTNVDLAAVSRAVMQRTGIDEFNLTPALILSHFAMAHQDVSYAARLNAEVASSYYTSPLVEARFGHFVRAANASAGQIFRFSESVLDTGRAIGDAIVAERASFDDLLQVLNRRRKFREWLAGRPFDADLVKDYFGEMSRESWIESLPGKIWRWAIPGALTTASELTLGPMAGLATGVALAGFDLFLLQRAAGGWRPNQFVDAKLRPLISDE